MSEPLGRCSRCGATYHQHVNLDAEACSVFQEAAVQRLIDYDKLQAELARWKEAHKSASGIVDKLQQELTGARSGLPILWTFCSACASESKLKAALSAERLNRESLVKRQENLRSERDQFQKLFEDAFEKLSISRADMKRLANEVWTEAMKLASQHRLVILPGQISQCSCGWKPISCNVGDEWAAHIISLQRPQPKPEPRYAASNFHASWIIMDRYAKFQIAYFNSKLVPNAEARARKLCDELNRGELWWLA